MAKHDCGLAIISERYRVPVNHSHWIVDKLGLVAIMWRQTRKLLSCIPIKAGEVCDMERYVICIYISPNIGASQFEERLELLEACLGRLSDRSTVLAMQSPRSEAPFVLTPKEKSSKNG